MFASIDAVGLFENFWRIIPYWGPMKESVFGPVLVFRKGQISFR